MAALNRTLSPRVTEVFSAAKHLTAEERLVLAKLLLDSVLANEALDETDWRNLGLASFEHDWDNPDDAIYDNWRELYGVQPR
ncbi:MAG TPA: hypothetical protein VGX03_26215 [Candidatus Binatia bacterium]|jgi:hypothetical protein|nr:hypothetical protein [Candidatus Binatia bacterium]